ncbi:aminodeoxychorismate/anthranilate synthase component II [Thermocladium modestius]|uniref:anthranilate synthase n=1 Tax=Thermocladium modestius TaxID=62609 RepID=A0A830GTK6_9CREN|nr:aminodeoxychorismate/anthranilate synthase component II [Thermocladium modestius]GGP18888.1 aminodeoxychorismate/anthranilate synthase component II [Thermocladium modestius]
MDLTIIIDNYDSFVYNVAQYVGELGSRPVVVRNDEVSVKALERMRPDRLIISPGPGSPLNERDVGVSREAVLRFGGRIPVLGICLGHQLIGVVFGARIRRARTVRHGKASLIRRMDSPLYLGLPGEFKAMRYHSLAIDDVPEDLVVDAVSMDDNEVMGIHHVEHPIFGVQFHPESVGTRVGMRILSNFLNGV